MAVLKDVQELLQRVVDILEGVGDAKIPVDTELVLNAESIVANVSPKVGSTDQTIPNSKFLKTNADGELQNVVIASSSNIAKESGGVLDSVLAQLDIKNSEVLSGIQGVGPEDLTTLKTVFDNIQALLSRSSDLAVVRKNDIDNIAKKIFDIRIDRKAFTVKNMETVVVPLWIGKDATVTKDNGWPLPQGEVFSDDDIGNYTGELWVIAEDAGPYKIAAMETW